MPLVFELCNLKRSKEFLSLSARKCNMSMDKYVTSIETLEYSSFVEAYNIRDACQKRSLWQDRDDFKNFTSLEECLETQELTGHTDVYRVRWIETCYLS